MNSSGKRAEDAVESEYKKQGYKTVAKNFIFPKGKQMGELDLVMTKDSELVFVEVKMRNTARYGSPFEAVDRYKQRKLVKTAKLFLLLHKEYKDFEYRIDVAAVAIDNGQESVNILTNAIEDLD